MPASRIAGWVAYSWVGGGQKVDLSQWRLWLAARSKGGQAAPGQDLSGGSAPKAPAQWSGVLPEADISSADLPGLRVGATSSPAPGDLLFLGLALSVNQSLAPRIVGAGQAAVLQSL